MGDSFTAFIQIKVSIRACRKRGRYRLHTSSQLDPRFLQPLLSPFFLNNPEGPHRGYYIGDKHDIIVIINGKHNRYTKKVDKLERVKEQNAIHVKG